jgi:hypothetical protein
MYLQLKRCLQTLAVPAKDSENIDLQGALETQGLLLSSDVQSPTHIHLSVQQEVLPVVFTPEVSFIRPTPTDKEGQENVFLPLPCIICPANFWELNIGPQAC